MRRRGAGAASLAHLAAQKRMSSTKSVDGLRVNENVVDIGVYTDPEWRVQPALRRPLNAWLAR
jgi:hypothetical protein